MKRVIRWMGLAGVSFLLYVLLYVLLAFVAPNGMVRLAVAICVVITAFWLGIRLLRLGARQAIWRLRNRHLVTYLFIAVVPILLIAALAATGGYFLVRQ